MGSGHMKSHKAGAGEGCRALGEQGGSPSAEAENEGKGTRLCTQESRKAQSCGS